MYSWVQPAPQYVVSSAYPVHYERQPPVHYEGQAPVHYERQARVRVGEVEHAVELRTRELEAKRVKLAQELVKAEAVAVEEGHAEPPSPRLEAVASARREHRADERELKQLVAQVAERSGATERFAAAHATAAQGAAQALRARRAQRERADNARAQAAQELENLKVEEGKLQRHLAMASSRWLPPELPETDAAALAEQRAEVAALEAEAQHTASELAAAEELRALVDEADALRAQNAAAVAHIAALKARPLDRDLHAARAVTAASPRPEVPLLLSLAGAPLCQVRTADGVESCVPEPEEECSQERCS